MSSPKARKGEAIVCSKGHRVVHFTADAPADASIPSDSMSIDGPLIPGVGQGYVCGRCDEVVALLENGERWRVHTARGWVS